MLAKSSSPSFIRTLFNVTFPFSLSIATTFEVKITLLSFTFAKLLLILKPKVEFLSVMLFAVKVVAFLISKAE